MAKAALEMAVLDAELRIGRDLVRHLISERSGPGAVRGLGRHHAVDR